MSEFNISTTPISESPIPLLVSTPTGGGSSGIGSPTPSLSFVPGPSGTHYSPHYQPVGNASTPTHSGGSFHHFGSISSGSSAGGTSTPKMQKQSSLSMARAAFLMIRIKGIFQKKKRKGYVTIFYIYLIYI